MKATIKDIKSQAKAIKDGGTYGPKAWNRLINYMLEFENVYEMWGEPCINRGVTYTPLSKIINNDFFYGN